MVVTFRGLLLLEQTMSDDPYSMRVRDDGVVVFRLPDQTRDTVNSWLEDLERLGQAWIENELVLLLIDMRGSGVLTPYGSASLTRVSKATAATSNIKTGFVVDTGTAEAYVANFVRSLGPLLGNKQVFTNDSEALKWLWRGI